MRKQNGAHYALDGNDRASKMSLNEIILTNLKTELNLARAKRYNNINADLPLDVIDNRIEVLTEAIKKVKCEMIEAAIREAQK